MDKKNTIELLGAMVERYEDSGRLVAEDMQRLFNAVGVRKQVVMGDNIAHAIGAVQLKLLKNILEDID